MDRADRSKRAIASAGRYGGTYAHQDIAFEFGSRLSPEFKVYLIKGFQRLKEDENRRLSLAWNLNRTLSKLNYRIHTDAIKAHLIPLEITPAQAAIAYATEADVLNVALFALADKLLEFVAEVVSPTTESVDPAPTGEMGIGDWRSGGRLAD